MLRGTIIIIIFFFVEVDTSPKSGRPFWAPFSLRALFREVKRLLLIVFFVMPKNWSCATCVKAANAICIYVDMFKKHSFKTDFVLSILGHKSQVCFCVRILVKRENT